MLRHALFECELSKIVIYDASKQLDLQNTRLLECIIGIENKALNLRFLAIKKYLNKTRTYKRKVSFNDIANELFKRSKRSKCENFPEIKNQSYT